ncbi:T9SS type A sorting domain-containing protein [Maribacter sp.]|uniref:T9SS type A sorting domain-containing protein n=1 Tax=Maribacter sp. TaxID=1897614 RepID=UPI0032973E53
MKFLISAFLLLLFCPLFGQNNEIVNDNISVNSGGGNATGITGNYSYSIGQLFFTPINDKVDKIELGVQYNLENEIPFIEEEKGEFLIYPNPVADVLKISYASIDDLTYNIIELSGKSMLSGAIKNNYTEINLEFLMEGMYVFVILQNNRIINSVKIIKK